MTRNPGGGGGGGAEEAFMDRPRRVDFQFVRNRCYAVQDLFHKPVNVERIVWLIQQPLVIQKLANAGLVMGLLKHLFFRNLELLFDGIRGSTGQDDPVKCAARLDAKLLEEYGWDQAEELVCNLAAKILGRDRGAPEELRLGAIKMFEPIDGLIDELASTAPADQAAIYDEDALVKGLVSGDLAQTFSSISDALRARVSIDRIVTTMVLLSADRMARTPVNLNPGWGSLGQELILASSVRTALRYCGFMIGAKALYHAAWQFFSDRWLNIPARSLTEPLNAAKSDASSEDVGLRTVLDAIETVQVREVGRHTREYLNAGFSGDRVLSEIGQSILKDDNGWNLVHALRVVFNEWKLCEGHPARNQLLIGLSRWATDVRKRAGSQSAAQTAQRFARGQTAVDLYES